MNDSESVDSVEFPIDGRLDLHTFRPDEVEMLVSDYLEECVERNILDVRIIHGKGRGVLRRIVHGVLSRHPAVVDFRLAGDSSSWGATVVRLKGK